MIRRRQQRGSVAPFLALAFGGALLATAYAIDTSRMTDGAGQLKRATDAAAMAVGSEYLRNADASRENLQTLAQSYVVNNLGMDGSLGEQIDRDDVILSEETDEQGRKRYRVDASFQARQELLGGAPEEIRVHSTAEVIQRPLEVALALANSNQTQADIDALQQLAHEFAQRLLEENEDTWIALVPYSDGVNVHDDRDPQRVRTWSAPDSRRPAGEGRLLNWFWTDGGYTGLTDGRLPDRRLKLLCLGRGLAPGQDFQWQQPPQGDFGIYWRFDLAANALGHAYADSTALSIIRMAYGDGVRGLIADYGCPRAELLPLSDDLGDIDARLERMEPKQAYANLDIAMGWAAMALSPAFRGSAGWGDAQRPLDFAADHAKTIVILNNSPALTQLGELEEALPGGSTIGGTGAAGTLEQAERMARRIDSLCASWQQRGLRTYYLELAAGNWGEWAKRDYDAFQKRVIPAIKKCTASGGGLRRADGEDFASAQAQLAQYLTAIAADLQRQRSSVRLVE